MGESMKFLVTLKRKPTLNEAQNARQIRVEVSARTEQEAKEAALSADNYGKYFSVASVRRA